MRGERATLGKSLLDVQRELKIKAAYIAAIENADPAAFETPGFVAGYVRSYARYLGMDPDWTYRAFCDEADFSTAHGLVVSAKRPQPEARATVTDRDEPFTNVKTPFLPMGQPIFAGIEPGALSSIAVLLVLIGAIGYGGVAVLREVQKVQFAPVEQAPDVLADIDPLSGASATTDSEADDPAATATAAALDRLYRPKALDVPVLTARDGPIAALDPRTVGTLAPGPRQVAEAGPVEPSRPVPDFDRKRGQRRAPGTGGARRPRVRRWSPCPTLRRK